MTVRRSSRDSCSPGPSCPASATTHRRTSTGPGGGGATAGAGCDDDRMVAAPPGAPVPPGPGPRFLTLTDVAEVLNTSSAQVYALVRRGELKAIKIGGRGQWRGGGARAGAVFPQVGHHNTAIR